MWIVGYTFFNLTSAPKAGQPNNAEVWLKNWGLVGEKFHFSMRFDFNFLGYLWHLHFHHWLYLLLSSIFLYLIRHSNIFTLHMTTYWVVQSFCLGGCCQGLKYEDWSHCLTARKADSEGICRGAKETKKTTIKVATVNSCTASPSRKSLYVRLILLLVVTLPPQSTVSSLLFCVPSVPSQQFHKYLARNHRIQTLLEQTPDLTPAESAELLGLQSKPDTYNVTNFTPSHLNFKKYHNEIFSNLTSASSLLFYLDGPTASTTLHLLNTSHPPQNLYTANYSPTTSSHLSTLLPNSYHGPASTVLSTTLSSIPFSGAYLDLCTGQISKILSLLSCLLPRISVGEEFVLGVTITNASPCGKSLCNRVIEMEQFIFKQGWEKVERVFDEGEKWGVEGGWGEDGGVVCLWYVLER
ncbi:hypothetical protein TrST_g11525 [Triparma strigata]|uniref:Uncharacterized protein n=1 Tax=Triparma strigata TaxID=1606541 RepID=A0A9W7F334_9STRA|nr:hypothetical protein TrST_g11525 [Triparma strigata]